MMHLNLIWLIRRIIQEQRRSWQIGFLSLKFIWPRVFQESWDPAIVGTTPVPPRY